MNCPNCGKELNIDETQQTISCECGKVFKNPLYNPPVEEKKSMMNGKKSVKELLPYIVVGFIIALSVVSLILGSVCLATVKPTTGVAMAKKLQKAGYDVELYNEVGGEAYYLADANGRMIARLRAEKDDDDEDLGVYVYFFSTKKAAKKYYEDLVDANDGDDDYRIEIKGKKIFMGNREAVRDAMD